MTAAFSKSRPSLEELKARPGRHRVSVIITTFNEEWNIADCVESVLWADEIFMVDSYSTDRTMEIARQYPIVSRRREYFGSAAQKNWSIDRVKHDWVLVLDADERVPADLACEILALLGDTPEYRGYYIRRENIMAGKMIKHSGWSTDKVIRLFHRAHGRYPNRRVHADVDIEGPIPILKHALIHYPFRNFDQYLEKSLNYARWGAAQGFREGRDAGFNEIGLRPLWRFLRAYFLQLGILDGLHGLVVCGLQSFGVFVKYAWLWDHRIQESLGHEVELPSFDDDSSTWERHEDDTAFSDQS